MPSPRGLHGPLHLRGLRQETHALRRHGLLQLVVACLQNVVHLRAGGAAAAACVGLARGENTSRSTDRRTLPRGYLTGGGGGAIYGI